MSSDLFFRLSQAVFDQKNQVQSDAVLAQELQVQSDAIAAQQLDAQLNQTSVRDYGSGLVKNPGAYNVKPQLQGAEEFPITLDEAMSDSRYQVDRRKRTKLPEQPKTELPELIIYATEIKEKNTEKKVRFADPLISPEKTRIPTASSPNAETPKPNIQNTQNIQASTSNVKKEEKTTLLSKLKKLLPKNPFKKQSKHELNVETDTASIGIESSNSFSSRDIDASTEVAPHQHEERQTSFVSRLNAEQFSRNANTQAR